MLLGTEFKTDHPFTIIPDDTYDHFSESDLKDFTEMENLVLADPDKHTQRIRELFEKHENKTNFITLYTNALSFQGRVEEAISMLKQQLLLNKNDLDLKMRLAMFYLQKDEQEEVFDLMGPFLSNLDKPPIKEINESQFLNFCQLAAVYYSSNNDRENLFKVYSWTLDENFEHFNKNMACMIASTLISPMPEKFEDIDIDEENINEPIDTYFHHLDLNKDPYYLPFKDYHNIYLDEISLQDIRKIEALSNISELEHDVKWLIKNEFEQLKNHEGVFDPAGGKFAFILASAKNLTNCLPELLATLRLPELPYFDFLFKENFFEYILNPFYHLGIKEIQSLYHFLNDQSNSDYTRTAIAVVLNIIAKENPVLEDEVKIQLQNNNFQGLLLPDPYEIIENKIPQLIKHFIDIPVDYFEEDEFDDTMGDESSMPDSIDMPGGGIISKPTSLETAVFSNYMLANMEIQKERDKYAPPPNETTAQLKPILNFGKIGRNDPCPCGSGKKYKKCCLNLN